MRQMGPPPATRADDEARVRALHELGILDTPHEERFDRTTRMAARLFEVPIVVIALVDAEREWLKSSVGIDRTESVRADGLCAHAMLEDRPTVVRDARHDERFANAPFVAGPPGIRFYAAQPIYAPNGFSVGALAIADSRPRELSGDDLGHLQDLARGVESELARVELGRALVARHESEELVRALLLATVEGVLGLDCDGRITFANPSAERLLGWHAQEMIGKVGHELFHHSYPDGSPYPRSECPTRRTLSGAEVVHLEDVFWRRDGSSFPTESLTAPLLRAGAVTGAVSTFRDVRERREVDRLKDEFASVVGHELRTPLTSIRASLGLLAAGVVAELPPGASALLGTAISNTDRLVRLINDILDLERLEEGAARLDLRPRSLPELVLEAVAVVEALAAAAGVELETQLGEALAMADGERLVQALTNLLGNAIKYSSSGQTVTIATGARDGEATVTVTDRGRGIPTELHESIFERFGQVDGSDARDRGGTGLGLTIARRIVEAHRGRIWVDSAPGAGASFMLALPAAVQA